VIPSDSTAAGVSLKPPSEPVSIVTVIIASRYGRIRVLRRRTLEAESCECYDATWEDFVGLGL